MSSLKTTSLKTKSIIHQSLTVSCGLLFASLTLTGNALAADAPVAKAAHAHPVTHVVRRAPARQPDLGQIIETLFGFPFAVGVGGGSQGAGEYVPSTESPTYDTGPTIDYGAEASQMAADAAQANGERELNDCTALTASMAAAEEQNDAANAATLQTVINAGM